MVSEVFLEEETGRAGQAWALLRECPALMLPQDGRASGQRPMEVKPQTFPPGPIRMRSRNGRLVC